MVTTLFYIPINSAKGELCGVVVQWLRVCLPGQGTSSIPGLGDFRFCGAVKPVGHSY